MKKAVLALALFASISVLGLAQMSEQDQAKAMEAYMKAGAVTADHEALKYFAGRWKVAAKMWAAPGAPATESVNESVGDMILGGRYVRLMYKGEMMGQPFEGLQITGYDNIEMAYKTLWIDNSSTSFMLLTGKFDAAKRTYTFKGSWADPLGGITPVRMTFSIVSADEYRSEMYMGMPDGTEFLSMADRSVRLK